MVHQFKQVSYDRHVDQQHIAGYYFFTDIAGIKLACVFTNIKTECGLNSDGSILRAIDEVEQLNLSETAFFELQTHVGWEFNTPRGCYEYRRFEVTRDKYGLSSHPHEDVEYPLVVYDTFKSVIGTFRSMREVISKDHPAYGKTYATYSPEKLEAELLWACEWFESRDHWAAYSYNMHPNKILTPDEARKRGYRYDLMSERYTCLPNDLSEFESKGAVVDLIDSHLLGQRSWQLMRGELDRPERFSVWSRVNA